MTQAVIPDTYVNDSRNGRECHRSDLKESDSKKQWLQLQVRHRCSELLLRTGPRRPIINFFEGVGSVALISNALKAALTD